MLVKLAPVAVKGEADGRDAKDTIGDDCVDEAGVEWEPCEDGNADDDEGWLRIVEGLALLVEFADSKIRVLMNETTGVVWLIDPETITELSWLWDSLFWDRDSPCGGEVELWAELLDGTLATDPGWVWLIEEVVCTAMEEAADCSVLEPSSGYETSEDWDDAREETVTD